jgi:Flp pilus assembly protein TadD
MADHYTYIPSIGIFIALSWGVAEVTATWRGRSAFLAAAATLVIGACLKLAFVQTQLWRDSETLFRHTLAVTHDNPVAEESLGAALAGQGKIPEAAEHFSQAVAIDPNYAQARCDLGLTEVLAGKLDEGILQYRAALALAPQSEIAHFNLARALALQGRFTEAVPEYEAALQLRPDSPETRAFLADALIQVGQTNEAAVQLAQVLQAKPNDPGANERYGLLLEQAGKPNEAIAPLREAVRLEPTVERHQNLAQVLVSVGQPALAVAEYREALRLQPDSVAALNNLAWLLATTPDNNIRNGSQAATLAEHACRLTEFKTPLLVGTLAAAYAEAGRFDEAVKVAEQAKQLAAAFGQTALAKKNNQLLELYRAHQPYHEPVR